MDETETATVVDSKEADNYKMNLSACKNDLKNESERNLTDCYKVNLLPPPPTLRVDDPSQQANGRSTSFGYAEMVQKTRNAYYSGKTRPVEWRIKQLKGLLRLMEENLDEMHSAITADLGRHTFENMSFEVSVVKNEILIMLENVAKWSVPEMPSKSIINLLDSVKIFKDPYGVVLIIGAWNYPIQLTLGPMAGAIGAGNCVILKPSEVAPETAKFIARNAPKYLDTECYQVILGGVPETTELLKQRFDHIFYTGSSTVAKIIGEAASRYLTPLTFELGGKSPTYIDSSAQLHTAVKRIMWAKCVNAGQICLAPDYLMCAPDLQDSFVKEAAKVLKELYGDNPKNSPDFARIINDRQFQRLSGFLSGNGKIAIGGDTDRAQKYIAPTLLIDVKPTDPIMREEIFGPILPIISVANAEEAVEFINSRDKPLALYIFSQSDRVVSLILENTSSGGVCVNDVIVQVTVHTLPFGGVGGSGMGCYHGKYSFDNFVHEKSVLGRSFNSVIETVSSCRYPPYSEGKLKFITFLTAYRSDIPGIKYLPYVIIFGLGILAAMGIQAILTNYGGEEE